MEQYSCVGCPLPHQRISMHAVAAFNFPVFSYEDSLSNAYRINYTPTCFLCQ